MIQQIVRFLSLGLSILYIGYIRADISENLDEYLQQNGYFLSAVHSQINEGYSSDAQREAFFKDLQKSPHINTIAEVGFNAGHSCELFLNSSDQIEVTSFDIGRHPYTKVGVEFMQKKYPTRFEFILGDSGVTLQQYATASNKKFDLIFIDGCHEFNHAVGDIYNCRRLAHKNTEAWIDDYAYGEVQKAVEYCVNNGIITIIEAKSADDASGLYSWVKVRYNHLSEAERYFSDVYDHGIWGRNEKGQGSSGPGSAVSQAIPFIQYVQSFLETHEVNSIVDVGCGDWVLAREINWGQRNYLGIDVVESVIEENQKNYSSNNIHFLKWDAGIDPIPSGDLLICKDVFIHLPYSEINNILKECKKFKYCIFVNDVVRAGLNTDLPTYGYRCVYLTAPPFNLTPMHMSHYISHGMTKEIVLTKQ